MRVHTLRVKSRAVQRRQHLIAGNLVIDGQRLYDQVERVAGRSLDLASPLGWMPAAFVRLLIIWQMPDQPPFLVVAATQELRLFYEHGLHANTTVYAHPDNS